MFTIDQKCPTGAFNPTFTASSLNGQGGAYTSFVASFERSDSEQELAGLEVKLPPGLSANIADVPECSERQIEQAEAGTGGYPEASQVGTVKAGVGPGPDPFFATGKVYWTGPYNGGPFGLAVVVPAIAGPFNFGTVVVRQSIRLDPTTAQVTDVSDKFPTIIDGIPLRMRQVEVELNRPGSTFNPTDCNKFESNPAGCPAASKIGYAMVHTPILPAPLTGPAIFVSHGGEAFPSLTMVLQGDGVTIDLVGTTFISKAGVTSTTFKTVPDTPFSTLCVPAE